MLVDVCCLLLVVVGRCVSFVVAWLLIGLCCMLFGGLCLVCVICFVWLSVVCCLLFVVGCALCIAVYWLLLFVCSLLFVVYCVPCVIGWFALCIVCWMAVGWCCM